MKINTTNINRIHDVLITDIQRLLFKQYNARKNEFGIQMKIMIHKTHCCIVKYISAKH